jgi:hypothetical protein
MIDPRFTELNTDITVVFEGSEPAFQSQQAALSALQDRSRYSYVIYSVPSTLNKAVLKTTVNQLSQHAEFLFLTDLTQNYYERFGTLWRTLIDVIPA